MLTTKKKDNVRIACYIKNNNKVVFIYAQDDINENDIIEDQGNLLEYLDISVFASMKSPNKGYIIEMINNAISRGVSLTPRNSTALMYNYYALALQNIYPKLKRQLLAEPGCRFMICPTLRYDQRDYIKISAPAGAGKSTVASNFAETWHFTYPRYPIYLICAKDRDKCYDALPYINRIPKDDWINFMCKNNEEQKKIIEAEDEEEEEIEEEEEKEEEPEPSPKKQKTNNNDDDNDDDEKEGSISCEASCESNKHGDEHEESPVDEEIQFLLNKYVEKPKKLPPAPKNTKIKLPLKKYIEQEVKKKSKSVKKKKMEKPEEIEYKEIAFFKDSLFIFDDIDKISPNKLQKAVNNFKDYVSQLGRSENVNLILCDHMLNNYQKTRNDLNECTAVVIFPRTNPRHIKRYLGEDYVGFDKHQMQEIMSEKNRWVMVYTQHPQAAVTENKVWIIKK